MSPRVIVDLLEVTGPWVVDLFRSTDPFAPAHWAVTWAGEETLAALVRRRPRLHRALAAPAADPRRGRRPAADRAASGCTRCSTCSSGRCRSLSGHAGRGGTSVRVTIEGAAGGDWTLRREAGAVATLRRPSCPAAATVTMTDDTAWRLFSKGLEGDAARARVKIGGDQALGAVARGRARRAGLSRGWRPSAGDERRRRQHRVDHLGSKTPLDGEQSRRCRAPSPRPGTLGPAHSTRPVAARRARAPDRPAAERAAGRPTGVAVTRPTHATPPPIPPGPASARRATVPAHDRKRERPASDPGRRARPAWRREPRAGRRRAP